GCSVVVEVALVVVVVEGPGWPMAAIGFQRTTSTAATIATPRTPYPVPSLPTCRAVDNGVLYSTRPPGARVEATRRSGGCETPRSVPSIEVRNEAPAGAAQVVAVARVVPEEPLLHERARIQREQRGDRDQRVACGGIAQDVPSVAQEVACIRRMAHHAVEAGRLDPAVRGHHPEAAPETGKSEGGGRNSCELERLAEPAERTGNVTGPHEERQQRTAGAEDPICGAAGRGEASPPDEDERHQHRLLGDDWHRGRPLAGCDGLAHVRRREEAVHQRECEVG